MPRPPVETIADQLFYTTVFIETFATSRNGTGTGFIINYPGTNNEITPVLITNKHVFDGAVSATFTMVQGGADGQPVNQATQMHVPDFHASYWVGHPDSGVDVAALFLGEVLNAMKNNDAPAYFKAFLPEQLATQEEVEMLDSLEQITMIGYPNGLFDTMSRLPIARRGQTATPIFNDYNRLPAFLIDASVFPGSSGSPVVLFDRGSYTTRDGSTQLGTRFALLGVVAAVHTRRVNGVVQMVDTGIAAFDDMIDLGIVFKASAVQETVFTLFAHHGLPLPIPAAATHDLA